jgi:hypothetical protein
VAIIPALTLNSAKKRKTLADMLTQEGEEENQHKPNLQELLCGQPYALDKAEREVSLVKSKYVGFRPHLQTQICAVAAVFTTFSLSPLRVNMAQ